MKSNILQDFINKSFALENENLLTLTTTSGQEFSLCIIRDASNRTITEVGKFIRSYFPNYRIDIQKILGSEKSIYVIRTEAKAEEKIFFPVSVLVIRKFKDGKPVLYSRSIEKISKVFLLESEFFIRKE